VQHKAKFVVPNENQGELSPKMIDIINKALSNSPEKRYQWVEDLREDFS